jgi:hypothetical protein
MTGITGRIKPGEGGEEIRRAIEKQERREREKQERRVHAQAHVIGLLNQVEATLTGWVLGEDREKVAKLTSPLYDLCDKD